MDAAPIPYASIASGSSTAADDLCERLHRQGYALVRFPPEAEAEVEALRELAAGFFALPPEQKRSIGDFRFVGDTYAGYRDSAHIDAEFLEVHVCRGGGTYPPLALPAGLSPAAAALHGRLDGMARLFLRLLAAHLEVPSEAFLAPLEAEASPAHANGSESGEGGESGVDGAADALSASVLRVCHYRRRAEEAAGARAAAADGEDDEVLFEAHTDSSLLTLSTLCPAAPGLQLEEAGEWLSVERLEGVDECDVEVHVGDFLSFLSRDYFPSCVHRVTRPKRGPGRLSFPFLVRPRNEHVLDTRAYDPSRSKKHLVEVEGITCRELRKLFDARGKRMLDERRAADEAHEKKVRILEAERKARAAAFRAKLLASGGKLDDSSSSSEEGDAATKPPPAKAGAARAKAKAPAPAPTPAPAPAAALSPLLPSMSAAASSRDPRALTPPPPRPPPRTRWTLRDLPSLRYGDHLFVFKQHDLHMVSAL